MKNVTERDYRSTQRRALSVCEGIVIGWQILERVAWKYLDRKLFVTLGRAVARTGQSEESSSRSGGFHGIKSTYLYVATASTSRNARRDGPIRLSCSFNGLPSRAISCCSTASYGHFPRSLTYFIFDGIHFCANPVESLRPFTFIAPAKRVQRTLSFAYASTQCGWKIGQIRTGGG